MANQEYILYNDVIVHVNVRDNFMLVKQLLADTLGLNIDIVESIKSEYEITLELVERYKYKRDLKIQSIESESDERYLATKLIIESSDITAFEPPIERPVYANAPPYDPLYPIPNYPQYDPRRTGRIVRIGPSAIVNPTILSFMVQNAGRYGFIHYGPLDPTIWYWRGDKSPFKYTPAQSVSYYSSELSYLL